MNSSISDLPVRAAIAVVLKDVAYTNPMPDWFAARKVDYSARQTAIENTIDKYLKGSSPGKPFEVLVPRKRAGDRAKWLQPSVNDQMVLQSCVSALAPKINASFDRKRVFSYRLNANPNVVRLTEDRCSAWDDYVQATTQMGQSCTHVMLLDIQQSFASINRDKFWEYLKQFNPGIELQLLRVLLDSYTSSPVGLPLINDSLFFLGNAYLGVVDRIISKHTRDFHRFVDDYCIFGVSKNDLESLYRSINQDLQKEGLRLNDIKTNIVTANDYCDRLSEVGRMLEGNNLVEGETDAYVPVPTGVDPNIMVSDLGKTVQNPDKYLNDGTGRAQLASLRKLRDSLPESARAEFAKDLCESAQVLQACLGLLRSYSPKAVESWRSVWVLYLLQDVKPESVKGSALASSVKQTLQDLQTGAQVPEVVKLWARVHQGRTGDLFEQLSGLDYLDAGRHCCGG